MARISSLPKRLQPMLATLTDAPFDDPACVFEDKYDGFRMIAELSQGKIALESGIRPDAFTIHNPFRATRR